MGYAYRLTDDGNEVIPDGDGDQETINKVVSSAILHFSLNPRLLATAAKVHFILAESKEQIVPSSIREQAGRLDWNIDEKDLDKIIGYLNNLGLT